ncbi:hypothetical protein [Natranaerobius thermophilus]|uniref:Uncharacterized protein n=1 Tax=Natranaerobius thermophilus (strain ATCC BAA-1301 / DSM 18059 / JW/NM-WN-LF) TaxID=457570 RepID=B2A1J2_NATTJ|nr:hypothetical protein [Natranaerobius thermophilus]ACB84732.1 hypothetical protein Nther_1149 [Natranaerobius thermophilus JW/NM-WN-LF]
MRDYIQVSVYAGTLAALGAFAFLLILSIVIPFLGIDMFLPAFDENFSDLILTLIWSIVVGIFYAFIYLLTLIYTGWENSLTKALAVIIIIWLIASGPIMLILNILPPTGEELLPIIAFFWAHILFAILLRFWVERLRDRFQV